MSSCRHYPNFDQTQSSKGWPGVDRGPTWPFDPTDQPQWPMGWPRVLLGDAGRRTGWIVHFSSSEPEHWSKHCPYICAQGDFLFSWSTWPFDPTDQPQWLMGWPRVLLGVAGRRTGRIVHFSCSEPHLLDLSSPYVWTLRVYVSLSWLEVAFSSSVTSKSGVHPISPVEPNRLGIDPRHP